MELPSYLLEAFSAYLAESGVKKIQKAAKELSNRYREKQNTNTRFIQNKDEAIAYLCMRFPATFAVNCKVFERLSQEKMFGSIQSMLDLGSGSGSSVFAALSYFPSLKSIACIEQDPLLIELGKDLFSQSKSKIKTTWVCDCFTKPEKAPSADLVVFSYSLGEAPKNSFGEIFEKIVPLVDKYLVIIEPGTPVGFERVLHARELLLDKGLHLLAPCPHTIKCPMNKTFKWCHFSQRLPRTSFHKYLKEASLGYEDEKYSYVVFSKTPLTNPLDRIVAHPKVSAGFATFEVCSKQGELETKKILKRDVENFGFIKKLEWGDTLPE